MALDPVLALASGIAAKPGVYAILMASGVSRPAGIPSGWEIAVDLAKRIGVGAGELGPTATPEEVETWYTETRGEIDYSEVMEDLAAAPGERLAILDSYFDPSDEDREQGLKEPTAAHRAVARLVREGSVRIVITTNFDRLIERALQDAGVEPTVIDTPAAAESAPPLHAIEVLVVKLHGDRRSPNIKNTLSELASYEPAMKSTISQILDEYGLIVVGWSGEWDAALRQLMIDHVPALYSTFVCHRGNPTDELQDVIRARAAIAVSIEDADSFFEDLEGRVSALREIERAAAPVSIEPLKQYLPDYDKRIRLRDLVSREVSDLHSATSIQRFPVDAPSGGFDGDYYLIRIRSLEAATVGVAEFFANLAFYSDEERHEELLFEGLERLTSPVVKSGGNSALLALQLYPHTLVLYATGIASLAANRPATIFRALTTLGTKSETDPAPLSVAWTLNPPAVIKDDGLREIAEYAGKLTPASNHFHSVLRGVMATLIPDDATYDRLFDDFEYLIGLRMVDNGQWGLIGRFSWNRKYEPIESLRDVAEIYRQELLDSGFAEGDTTKLTEVLDTYEANLKQYPIG